MFSTNYAPIQNMIFVSEEEARNYFIPANSKVLLMGKEKPVFYVKTSDSLGQTVIETYSFKKVEPQTNLPSNAVSKDDFDAFKREILALIKPQEDQNHVKSTNDTEW